MFSTMNIFPLLSIGVFMIFMASGNSHMSLTLILVILLLSLNYRESQESGRRSRMETLGNIIKNKCDTEWMISALAPFKDPPVPVSLMVDYTDGGEKRTKQLQSIRGQLLGIAQGIVSNFPHNEIVNKCAEMVASDLGKDTAGKFLNNWDRMDSVYVTCVLQNIWSPDLPPWIYGSLLQQYGTAPLMLCLLAIRAYFTPLDQLLRGRFSPAPEDILVSNANNEIRMVMDYRRVFMGATLDSLLQYSDGASVEQIEDLIRRLDKKEVITPVELRWILTAEYVVRFKNNPSTVWTLETL